jgi:hypothetical protein
MLNLLPPTADASPVAVPASVAEFKDRIRYCTLVVEISHQYDGPASPHTD